mgnify:CR=1 FL=1
MTETSDNKDFLYTVLERNDLYKKYLKPFEITDNNSPSFIGGWFLEDLSVCDALIELFEKTDPSKKSGGCIRKNGELVVDKRTKNSTDMTCSVDQEAGVRYSVELQKVLEHYWNRYVCSNMSSRYEITQLNMQKYPKGGAYHKWHCERSDIGNVNRKLVYMTYLNDVEDGGETEFFYQKLKVKPRKGLTLIWPVDWTHTHRGLPSMTSEKYIITGWYDFCVQQEVTNNACVDELTRSSCSPAGNICEIDTPTFERVS